jgi:diketogulonate reductase-like aldo/keto reductase
MPLVGLGVYQNKLCFPACLSALEHGYRQIDTTQMYKNEEVGRAVKVSGLEREGVFISA